MNPEVVLGVVFVAILIVGSCAAVAYFIQQVRRK